MIGAKIGVSGNDLSPWYTVSQSTLLDQKVGPLLIHYGSRYNMVVTVYPEYDWKPWKFTKLPRRITRSSKVVSDALAFVEESLSLTTPEHWYRVSKVQLNALGVLYLISQNGGLFQVLKKFRPDFDWKEADFIRVSSSGERLLGAFIRLLFPEYIVLEKFELVPPSKAWLLSYYIPKLKLGFYYQSDRYYGFGNTSGQISVEFKADQAKVEVAKDSGISIVFVPFWWDRTLESLSATIIDIRYDLMESIESRLNALKISLPSNPIPQQSSITASAWKKRKSAKSK